MIKLAALPDSERRRMAAPLPQYGQHTTSTVPASVPQLGAPLPSGRPEASSSSFSNNRELEIDAEARKQELYRRKVEQATVEREAYRKWQEDAQRLREVTEEFDKCVMSSGNSAMDKMP